LTGAGFTHNFGGYLARDMWALIFNNPLIDDSPSLKNALREDFNYERVYTSVLNENIFSQEDRNILTKVVREAYGRLDESIRTFSRETPINDAREIIKDFSMSRGGSGLFFTLNQDLFVERFLGGGMLHPGLADNKIWTLLREREYDDSCTVFVPIDKNDIKQLSTADDFLYIKLHGSFNWKKADGSDVLVIGRYKMGEIENEPLLDWYFKLFQVELSKENRKLLCIGYGFGDDHINEVIYESLKNGLKLYIISPSDPADFKNYLFENRIARGESIWEGLSGYYPCKLSHIFNTRSILRDIRKTVFGY
jgi:hypothetical protein